MNKFNNFFEGAASLYNPGHQIIGFLETYKDKGNLKLQSVCCDAKCQDLLAFFRALGLIFCRKPMPHTVCVCQYHENVNLLLKLLVCIDLSRNHHSLLETICCDTDSEECMVGDCTVAMKTQPMQS